MWIPKNPREIPIRKVEQLQWVLLWPDEATYLIEDVFNPTFELNAPNGVKFVWIGLDNSWFVCDSNNHSLFSWITAGNIFLNNMKLVHSWTNSRIFNIDNNWNSSTFECEVVNFWDFGTSTTELWTIDSFRQILLDWCAFINFTNWFTLDGTMVGGIKVVNSILLASQWNTILFDAWPTLLMQGSSTSDMNAVGAQTTDVIFNFTESNIQNDEWFLLTGARFNPNTTNSVTLDETSTKAFYTWCVGIKNTNPWFSLEFSWESITPLTVNTPTKALWTTTTTNNTWWSQTDNNEVTCDSTEPRDYLFMVGARVEWDNGDIIRMILRKYDDSSSSYIDLFSKEREIINSVVWPDTADYSFTASWEFENADRIELWVENLTDGSDIVVNITSQITCILR